MRTVQTGGWVEYTPVGHVTNLAARLQGVAPAGGIVLSEDTRRLVEGYFELRALGKTEVKGVSEPLQGLRAGGHRGRVYDRDAEDLGNIVALEHVNVTVPDQQLATLFYVNELGQSYMMMGTNNMRLIEEALDSR